MKKQSTPYAQVTALIENWAAFREIQPRGSLREFGIWLSRQSSEKTHFSSTYRFLTKTAGAMEETRAKPDMPNRAVAGDLIGRLTQFVKIYTKGPFHEIGLGSIDEFRILSIIHRLQNPNKSQLTKASLMDFSTVTDMLKRMEERGWIHQVKDERDKRSRRVEFTEKGREFMGKVYQTLAAVEPNLLGDLSPEEQEQLIQLLMRLNEFHTTYIENQAK